MRLPVWNVGIAATCVATVLTLGPVRDVTAATAIGQPAPDPEAQPLPDRARAWEDHSAATHGDEPGVIVVSGGRESKVRILGSLTVERGQRVQDAVAVLGSVTVRGEVEGDVVAVGGSVDVEDGASVIGNLVAVGGQLRIAQGARVSPHSDRVAIGFPHFVISSPGEQDVSFSLLPDRAWIAGVALTGSAIRLLALVLLALTAIVVFGATVERVSDYAAHSPGESLVVGIGVQLLLLPAVFAVCLAMVVTLIGIPLVPLFLLVVSGLWISGFAAAAAAFGRGLLRALGVRQAALLPAFLAGVVPALGLTLTSRIAWWSGAELGGWAMLGAILGALLEGVLWTMGAGAGVLVWLRRRTQPSQAPPLAPPAPPVPVEF
jgi:hypothetical protein